MRSPATVCEERAMLEPMIGLAVALGLALYLLYTLIRPERF
jgi:K+-transporting ATPase KdpF subunit